MGEWRHVSRRIATSRQDKWGGNLLSDIKDWTRRAYFRHILYHMGAITQIVLQAEVDEVEAGFSASCGHTMRRWIALDRSTYPADAIGAFLRRNEARAEGG